MNPKVLADALAACELFTDFGDIVGGGKKRFMCSDLEHRNPPLFLQLDQIGRSIAEHVLANGPGESFHCIWSLLKNLPGAPSQRSGCLNRLHVDYPLSSRQRKSSLQPFSVILGLNGFDLEVCQGDDPRSDPIVLEHVRAGQYARFTNHCWHAGGANTSGDAQYRMFFYFVSNVDDFPRDEVYFLDSDAR